MTRAPEPGGQRGQQRGLATRAGAQVQPSAGIVGDRRQSECASDQLAAFVLDQRLAVAHRRYLRGVAGGQVHRVRRVSAHAAVDGRGQILGGQDAGPGRQVHLGALIVGSQRRIEFAGGGAQRVDE